MAKIEAAKRATAVPAGLEITPSDGYDAMLEVIFAAEPNFLPENIAHGITIWGKTGTAKPRVTNGEWPFDGDPNIPSEDDFDDEVKKNDPSAPVEDKFVLADNLGNITTGYMYGDEFEITYYDPVTTEFRARGWRRVSYHTTGEHAGTYTTDDFTTQESGGWNYLKNIRVCTREKLYYNGVEIWPNANSPVLAPYPIQWSFNTSDEVYATGITEINIVDKYEPTGNESVARALDQNYSGSVMLYVSGTVATIAGCGLGKIIAPADCTELFANFEKATKITGLHLLDTSRVVSMKKMFVSCYKLTELDVSHFDTSNVTDMDMVFLHCNALQSVDVNSWDTRNVTRMGCLFYGCRKLESVNLSNWDTQNVTTLYAMFNQCESLTSLDLSAWRTGNVTSMESMVSNCDALQSIQFGDYFDTHNVQTMSLMFSGCSSLRVLDISMFDTTSVADVGGMFWTCSSLTAIYVGDGWNVNNVSGADGMFKDCGVSNVTRI